MRILDKLDQKLGRYAVRHLTVILIAGQSLFYVMFLTGRLSREATVLTAQHVMEGEWWRLLSLPFDPPRQGPIFVLLAWYFFYVMGSTLEQYWGEFRYNVYILFGCLITLAVSFLTPLYPVSNTFIAGSVFLAFAALFPDYQILLFFVLPIRIKWLAAFTWVGYGYQFIVGNWSIRLMVIAATANFFLFFSRDLLATFRQGRRRLTTAGPAARRKATESVHRCSVCGITDKTDPEMDFRYCPKCDGQRGYCQEHIFSHEHVNRK